MAERAIENIIHHHYRQLYKFIKEINKAFEAESIHQLRVEYKKLRAFLRMISGENKFGKKINLRKKLKRAYHIAGEIRDLQLQHQSMLAIETKELKPTVAYRQILERDINELESAFAGIPLKKTINKSFKKKKKLNGKKINAVKGVKFIKNNCTAIIALITIGHFTDANIHSIRKSLKDIYYTIHAFNDAKKKLKFGSLPIAETEMIYFDGLLDELGNFQDSITSLALLNDEQLKLLSVDDRQIMVTIRDTFNAGKVAKRNAIVIKLHNELIAHLQNFLLPVA